MIKFIAAVAMAAVLLSPPGADAQTPLPSPGSLPPYGRGIGLDIAKKMLDAAEAAARKNGWQEAIAVVDSGGRLVAFFRMDNTQLASIDIAIGKAVTANNVKRPTKALQGLGGSRKLDPAHAGTARHNAGGWRPADRDRRQGRGRDRRGRRSRQPGRRGRRRRPCRRHREVAAAYPVFGRLILAIDRR